MQTEPVGPTEFRGRDQILEQWIRLELTDKELQKFLQYPLKGLLSIRMCMFD